VVVYNQTFEAGVNQALAEAYPERAASLLAINDRAVSILHAVRPSCSERILCQARPQQPGNCVFPRIFHEIIGLNLFGNQGQ